MPEPPQANSFDSVSSVSSVVKDPLIGLTCRWDEGRGAFDLPAEYAEAVAAAGGVPVLIPLIPEQAVALAKKLDGIVLSGSPSDVDPARYGQPRQSSVTNVAPQLDATCSALLDFAERFGLPVLGICYGMQAINVHRGGTLIQHIPDDVPGAVQHQDREGRHDVTIETGTRLGKWANSFTQQVNSTHHQAVGQLGRDLRIAARSSDGVIEAMEYTLSNRFLVAVQWHPERIWREHSLSAKLFQELVWLATARKQAYQDSRITMSRSLELLRANEIAQAIDSLEKDIEEKLLSIHPMWHLTVSRHAAILCHRLEQYDRAISILQRALDVSGDEPSVLYWMGECASQLGRRSDARHYFKRCHQASLRSERKHYLDSLQSRADEWAD